MCSTQVALAALQRQGREGSGTFMRGKLDKWGSLPSPWTTGSRGQWRRTLGGAEKGLPTVNDTLHRILPKIGLEPKKGRKLCIFSFASLTCLSAPRMQSSTGTIGVGGQLYGRAIKYTCRWAQGVWPALRMETACDFCLHDAFPREQGGNAFPTEERKRKGVY